MPATNQTTSQEDDPFVSVIVPVYNDPDGVETTLNSLVKQTYAAERHEIIIVDNGSSDSTPEVIQRFCDSYEHVRIVIEPTGGSYTARNAGIAVATGTILSFVDADMSVPPDWLTEVVERMSHTGAAYLGCNVELSTTDRTQSLAERYNRQTAFPIGQYITDWKFTPTCCLTVRREVIDDVGTFDGRLVSGGDREFGNRVHNAGYDLEFADEITMTHPLRTSIRSLRKKAVRVGRGHYQLRWYYPERYGYSFFLLLNPLKYTPPLPSSMSEHVRNWKNLSVSQKLLFGLLAWLLNLAKVFGMIREMAAKSGWKSRHERTADPQAD